MKQLSILQVNKFYAPIIGGVERVVQDLSEGLRDRARVRVLVCQKKGGGQVDQVNGVEVVRARTPFTAFSMPLSLAFLRRFKAMSREADIVHLHMPFPLADVACLRSGFKGKVVCHWHSDVVRQKKLMKVYAPFMHRLLKRADIILTATQGHIDGSAVLGDYREKCAVVPYGIDAEDYCAGAQAARALPPTLPSHFHVLFVGRLVYYKGAQVLLEAAAQAQNVQVTFVGEGPLLEELKALSASLGLEERVHFLGALNEGALRACLRDCDALALPSVERSEAFGLVQLQAMCFGKPVINTDLPSGVPWVSLHEKTGLTVPPKDAAALAAAMTRLSQDRAWAAAMGEAGAIRVRSHFSMAAMIEGVYEQYRKLCP